MTRRIRNRDKELAAAFDPFSRSTATMQLAIMRRMDLLSDLLAVFSQPPQDLIRRVEELHK